MRKFASKTDEKLVRNMYTYLPADPHHIGELLMCVLHKQCTAKLQ